MSAFFPGGMESYNNTETAPLTAQYAPSKGVGRYSYPIAITSGNIRPLTNKDYTNIYAQKPGLARPLKWQYRKGTTVGPSKTILENPISLDEYIIPTREVKSSTSSSLVGQTIDQPGRYSVKENTESEINNTIKLNVDCSTQQGIGLVVDFKPETYLTNNPEPSTTNPKLCCNEEAKALKNVIYASTNLKKNYYTTHYSYLQNRCQTYDQKSFNFKSGVNVASYIAGTSSEPVNPYSSTNTFIANCYPNTGTSISSQSTSVLQIFELIKKEGLFTSVDISNFLSQQIITIPEFNVFLSGIQGNSGVALQMLTNFINNPYSGISLSGPSNSRGCKITTYKPSNPQFASEGGVSSSTRTLKLTVDTVSSNLNSINRLKGIGKVANVGGQPFVPFVYKNKTASCNQGRTTYMRFGYPVSCLKNKDDYLYKAFSKMGNIGGNVNGTQVYEVDISGVN